MTHVTLGDIVFILAVCALIYGILFLVSRSRGKKTPPRAVVSEDAGLRSILETAKIVAMVGASNDPERPSHHVMEYLLNAGYTIFPVNPREKEILGQPAFPSLADLPAVPDVVDVFRNPEHVPEIARDVLRTGARVLWLQEGVVSEEGAKIALEGGLSVVMDRCMLKEHRRLLG